MVRFLKLLAPVFILLFCYGHVVCEAHDFNGEAGEWEEVYNKDGIRIIDRWITQSNPTLKFRERKGVILSKCNAELAYKIIADSGNTKKWMKGVSICRDYNQEGNTWETYTLYGLPWPFDSREMYSRLKTTVSPEGYRKIFIQSIDTLINYQYKPLKEFYSEWTIKSIDNNYSEITMISATKMPPVIPLFLQDPILLLVYKENLIRLKALLENANTGYSKS